MITYQQGTVLCDLINFFTLIVFCHISVNKQCMFFLQNDADVAITLESMADCLSLLCKTGDGLKHAYVRFDAPDRYVKRE